MNVGIVGVGAVGRGIQSLFPDAMLYDEPLGVGSRGSINDCAITFVAVPTPASDDGSCDTSIVREVVSWIESDIIVIRSTVPPGTTERLRALTGKRIVFQPEYGPGETVDHPFNDVRNIDWIVLGGDRRDTVPVADLYKYVFSARLRIQQTDSRTAELTKYMENSYLAMKVAFCNEFYDIAGAFDVDYNELRELWLMDPRIERTHSLVHPADRGFGGKCLPKDLSAIISSAAAAGHRPQLLEALRESNDALRAEHTNTGSNAGAIPERGAAGPGSATGSAPLVQAGSDGL